MPGYVLLESDRNEIPAKYLCSFCGCLLKDPMQTSCGHCYCRSCISSLHHNGSSQIQCLACSELLPVNQIFPDAFMKREVNGLKVHCVNKEEGCNWKGEVRDLESHLATCDYLKVSCPHKECGKLLKKSDLTEHLQSECICRSVKCKYCQADVLANAMEEHQNTDCPAFPTKCSKCQKEVMRSKISQHQDSVLGDCDAICGPCPFKEAGCAKTEKMNSNERKKHMKDAAVSHLTLLLAMVMKLSEDVQNLITGEGRAASGAVATVMGAAASGGVSSLMGAAASSTAAFLGDSESTVRNLLSRMEGVVEENRDLRQKLREQSARLTSIERRTVSVGQTLTSGTSQSGSVSGGDLGQPSQGELSRRLVNLENKVADHNILLVENGRNVEDARHQHNYLQRQFELSQENLVRLEQRLESQDHMIALRNVAIADLEEYIRQQEVSSYDGVLLFKITEFARRRSDAQAGRQTSFYSPSFFSSRHGYKMCARIYLNGDGMGKGTHISLFFVVMRGQYDALLRWPFRQKVNLMILDQDNIEHIIDAFRPDPNSSSFQKPRREMNIASGCPLFFPLSDLDKHAYVRDDTMFVKIIVDTSDL